MEENQEVRECTLIWSAFPVCEGDIVTVYPRYGRSLVSITGRVAKVTNSALVIETENEIISIRYSEIKMISRPREK